MILKNRNQKINIGCNGKEPKMELGSKLVFIKEEDVLTALFCLMITVLMNSCASLEAGRYNDYIGVTVEQKESGNEGEKEVQLTPIEGTLKVGVRDALILALANNRSLKVEKFKPAVQQTSEEQSLAQFDFSLRGGLSFSKRRDEQSGFFTTTDATSADFGISRFFPTGTTASVEGTWNRTSSTLYGDQHTMRFGVTVTQALLKGYGVDVNLVSVKQARLDTLISEYELRGFVESLVSQVETTYWDYVLAQKQVKIIEESLALAEQQLKQTAERIAVGKLAETEMAAAEAELALRKQDLINARANLAVLRLKLLRLLNPPTANLWDIEIIPLDEPFVPDVQLDSLETHIKVALRMRPEMNQAKLQIQRGDLELIRTKNGLLPKLDVFLTLGKSGYADSFWDSFSNLDGKRYDFSAGVSFEFPLGNRSAKAQNVRSLLNHAYAVKSVENLAQLIEMDVRTVYIEINRAKEQVEASAATRKLQEEKLRAENEKFNVGKSTTFLVAQAQRDFMQSQVAEIESVVKYIKALIELYRLEGSLLIRRGISAPGKEPVDAAQ